MCTWLAFVSNFNGSSFFLNHNWITNSSLQLYTDASGSFGYGAVFKDQWFYGPRPDSWKSFNIAGLEFYPIVLSVIIWGHLMRNKRITFFTDNEALVHVINKNSGRDKFLMSFVRRLVLVCLQSNTLFRARHVPGGRMTWRTLCPVYRFRDFDSQLQHTCSSLWYLSRQSYNQKIGRYGNTFNGFQPTAIFSPYL